MSRVEYEDERGMVSELVCWKLSRLCTHVQTLNTSKNEVLYTTVLPSRYVV